LKLLTGTENYVYGHNSVTATKLPLLHLNITNNIPNYDKTSTLQTFL